MWIPPWGSCHKQKGGGQVFKQRWKHTVFAPAAEPEANFYQNSHVPPPFSQWGVSTTPLAFILGVQRTFKHIVKHSVVVGIH